MLPALPITPALLEAARVSTAWPFEEAKKLVARLEKTPKNGPIIFETGYGPSGLPHIGTFGEVARTTMVRNAFRLLTEDKVPTRLVAFSDDLDGLRKVPDNVPNKELLAQHLGRALTAVPDPFGTHDSFGAHNNARLRGFLDQFGFDYEFVSSTAMYRSGAFDATLMTALERFDAIQAIMLPTLGEERRATYSPFLPIHPESGVVMQVPVEERNVAKGTIVWRDPASGQRYETPVTGGHAKMQWKPDWAMRWTALGVDYEMAGKDLIDSVTQSGKICRALGGTPPEGFNYELFLDENGQKISKSKGNGLTIEDWLAYASPESLSLFMYQNPKSAKRLYFDVIPRNVDDYLTFVEKFPVQDDKARLMNPAWHIHSGAPPAVEVPISFSMLMNLVSVSNAPETSVLWGFIRRYAPDASPEKNPKLDELAGYAVRYFHDFVKPTKVYKAADEVEREALEALAAAIMALPKDASAEDVQGAVYDVGRAIPRYQDLKAKGATPEKPGVSAEWFSAIYKVLLGQEKGPRFGSFAVLYGLDETRTLIRKALAGEFVKG
ncbi:lysine--tRNA ligase [Phreatobacter oligotrophus]|uniref:lysine--tRNA ligase n=1 Tax=Phreatobacter oligotrophus TaxID=1122261 RepID=UPI002352E7CD|nr:lysine--tRNA ligase [Phreatobacter oligotrophus]MBX9989998.1 lysine--tRNA ligase [Phreatobacter oligotrophus]